MSDKQVIFILAMPKSASSTLIEALSKYLLLPIRNNEFRARLRSYERKKLLSNIFNVFVSPFPTLAHWHSDVAYSKQAYEYAFENLAPGIYKIHLPYLELVNLHIDKYKFIVQRRDPSDAASAYLRGHESKVYPWRHPSNSGDPKTLDLVRSDLVSFDNRMLSLANKLSLPIIDFKKNILGSNLSELCSYIGGKEDCTRLRLGKFRYSRSNPSKKFKEGIFFGNFMPLRLMYKFFGMRITRIIMLLLNKA